MNLTIAYRTHYRFTEPQSRLVQLLRVTPLDHDGQTVLDWHVQCDCDANVRSYRDGYGNPTTMLYVKGPVTELSLDIGGTVTTQDRAGVVMGTAEPIPATVFLRSTPLTHAYGAITAFAAGVAKGDKVPLDRMHSLNRQLYQRMTFEPGRTTVTTNAAQSFAEGHGVCQDYAHIFCAAARLMKIPARYVSGHLYRRDGAHDQLAAHAWAEAWIEGLGWVAFDPANGISPDDGYVRVAVGMDYRDASPLSGSRKGFGKEELTVSVRVQQQGQSQQ